MSKLISLKIDEKLLQDTEIMVSKLGISRNKYINDAVLAYTKAQKRAELEAQIKREVAIIRESSMEVLAEFEALEDDYEY
jgi:metal-responsive CopG/Arc/MetJ family transcriptional regulator